MTDKNMEHAFKIFPWFLKRLWIFPNTLFFTECSLNIQYFIKIWKSFMIQYDWSADYLYTDLNRWCCLDVISLRTLNFWKFIGTTWYVEEYK